MESIIDLYPTGTMPLNFIKAEIRYLNAVPLDVQKESPLNFLADKLHLKVGVDPELFELNDMVDKPTAVGINLAYPLTKPDAHLALNVNLGQVDMKPRLYFPNDCPIHGRSGATR